MNVFDIHKEQIEKFCNDNGYNIEKLKALPRCGNSSCLFFQTLDKANKGYGLTNETPSEIVLTVMVDNSGKYTFEKGNNADILLKQ